MASYLVEFFLNFKCQCLIERAVEQHRRTLNLSDFLLSQVPNELITKESEPLHNSIRRLNLSRNNLEILPSEFFSSFTRLETLSLAYNRIQMFPENFTQNMKQLTHLNISHNDLSKFNVDEKEISIPKCIFELENLRVLWANQCKINTIPIEIGQLEHLVTLGLRRNSISKLPDELFKLTSLRWLTVQNNAIRTVSAGINLLSQLVHLNLSHNQISKLHRVVWKYLENLRYVNLTYNFIHVNEDLITEIRSMPKFKKCHLSQNPKFSPDAYKGTVVPLRTTNDTPEEPTEPTDYQENPSDINNSISTRVSETLRTSESTNNDINPYRATGSNMSTNRANYHINDHHQKNNSSDFSKDTIQQIENIIHSKSPLPTLESGGIHREVGLDFHGINNTCISKAMSSNSIQKNKEIQDIISDILQRIAETTQGQNIIGDIIKSESRDKISDFISHLMLNSAQKIDITNENTLDDIIQKLEINSIDSMSQTTIKSESQVQSGSSDIQKNILGITKFTEMQKVIDETKQTCLSNDETTYEIELWKVLQKFSSERAKTREMMRIIIRDIIDKMRLQEILQEKEEISNKKEETEQKELEVLDPLQRIKVNDRARINLQLTSSIAGQVENFELTTSDSVSDTNNGIVSHSNETEFQYFSLDEDSTDSENSDALSLSSLTLSSGSSESLELLADLSGDEWEHSANTSHLDDVTDSDSDDNYPPLEDDDSYFHILLSG